MALEAGTRFGPYEIVSALGAGGMGEVYRARDTRLDRTVAIKILGSELVSNAALRARFEREARVIAQLNHPNICTVYDVGSENGTEYLVMEYLEGETLFDRLRRGPLPLDQVAKVGGEIAEALETAHRAGIIHRDVKPGNVMLLKSGAKLLDFGLAKPATIGASTGSGSAPLLSAAMTSPNPQGSPLTSAGTLIGTIQYMSPEQIQGFEADTRSDIFALGSVLYEMATGKRPFEGKSQLSLASSILEKDPEPITALREGANETLSHVIEGCLQKDPAQRWQSAGNLAKELMWAGKAPVSNSKKTAETGRRPLAMIAALAILLLIALAGTLTVLLKRVPPQQLKLQSDSGKHEIADAEYATVQLSPDGSRLAFVASDEQSSIFVRDLRTGKLDRIQNTEGAVFPFWSPDSRSIGFFASEKLKTVSLDQGTVQNVCDAPSGRGGSWSTDGQIVFTPNIATSLFVVPDSGGTPKAITPNSGGLYSDRMPFFLPDQKHFLYIQQTTRSANGIHDVYDLNVGSIDGSAPHTVLKGELDNPQYSQGRLLYGRSRSLYAQNFSLSSFSVSGKPQKIADDVDTYHGRASTSFSVSNSGLLAYRTTPVRFSELVMLDQSGRIETTFPASDKGWAQSFDLAKDSSKAAFCESAESASDTCFTWMLDLHSKALSKLQLELLNTQVVFTPKSDGVVYSTYGNFKKYSFATGSLEDLGVLEVGDYTFPVDMTSAGEVIVTSQRKQTGNDVASISLTPLSKLHDIVMTPRDESAQKVSPNGKWLPFCFDENGVTNLSIAALPEGRPQWQITTTGGCQASWSANGRELFYVAGNKVYSMTIKDPNDFALGPQRILFEIPSNVLPGVMMPDGKHFLGFHVTGKKRGGEVNVIVNWTASLAR